MRLRFYVSHRWTSRCSPLWDRSMSGRWLSELRYTLKGTDSQEILLAAEIKPTSPKENLDIAWHPLGLNIQLINTSIIRIRIVI